jgi:ribonuclease D
VADASALATTVAAFGAGTDPVAVDAERASGYRYGQRAYLVQLRRAGAGTALIDPIACPDLSALDAAIADAEWVFHAANQDLPCLAEVGLRPTRVFDTELAGRLAGFARVGLGPLVEAVLGMSLEKGHSASDWSTRPLPEPWLRYAALDVEVLVELRDALEETLREQGKLEWATQEFAAIVASSKLPPAPRLEPWRRTSGMHRVRQRRPLAVVRALWETRDELARDRDLTPSRLLPDVAIIEAALASNVAMPRLRSLNGFANRRGDDVTRYQAAIERARQLPEAELPLLALPSDAPPPPRVWADKDPAAAARLSAARTAVTELSEHHNLPVENLLTPDLLRRICWTPPEDVSVDAVAARLRSGGAREWQIALTAPAIVTALQADPS